MIEVKKDRFIFFISLGIFFLFVCLFSFKSYAAEDSPSYPMIIDFAKNPADTSLEDIQNAFSIMWGDLPDSYILYCSAHDQYYLNGSHGWDYYETFTYIISVNPAFDYPAVLSPTSPYYYITNGVEYYFEYIPDLDYWGSYNSATNIRHQYAYSYMAQGLGWILYGTEEEYKSIQDVVVWSHEHSSPDFYGHATAPINDPDNFVNDLNGHKITKPTFPTINNYSWTTYNNPSIDTSNVESLLESLWNSLVYNFSYLFSNLGGLFNTLTNNLENFVNYIADSIFYVCNNIVSAIQNFATDFYNNMVSLFEPMFGAFAYITEPLNLNEVETALNSSTSYSLVSVGSTFMNTYKDFFDNISAPSTLSFHIPYTILTKSGYIDFDFSWYADIRDSVLPWIVGFLYMGFGLALFRSFPSIIHGVSGILQKGG